MATEAMRARVTSPAPMTRGTLRRCIADTIGLSVYDSNIPKISGMRKSAAHLKKYHWAAMAMMRSAQLDGGAGGTISCCYCGRGGCSASVGTMFYSPSLGACHALLLGMIPLRSALEIPLSLEACVIMHSQWC